MTETMELAVVKPLTAQMVFVPGGVDDILNKITNEVRAHKPDISTEAGRAAIASLAYKVARSKTALDEMGKGLVTEWKAKAGAVDAERRTIRDRLDSLKDEVRKPLTDWENADKLRIEAHEKAIQDLQALLDFGGEEPTVLQLQHRIDILAARPDRQWDEFAQRGAEARAFVGNRLFDLHAAAVTREAERAELERLRAEQIAREQKERDDRIAAEAAERARIAAEAKAKAEAEEAAARTEQERQRLQREKDAERERAERAEIAAREAAEKAERDRKAAEAKAERDRIAAVEAEQKRHADILAAEKAATAKREADKKHRAKINNEVLAALAQAGISEPDGKTIIGLIASGNCPHVKISY